MVYIAKTDDPAADWDTYCEELERQPEYEAAICEWCGKPLDHQGDDYCIMTDTHEYICMNCSYQYWERKREEWEKPRLRCVPYTEKER